MIATGADANGEVLRATGPATAQNLPVYCSDGGASVAGFVEWVGYVLAGSRLSTFDPAACAPAGPFQVIIVTPAPRQLLASPAAPAPASAFDGDPDFLDPAPGPQAGIPVIATRAASPVAAAQEPVAVAFVSSPVASPAQSVEGASVSLLPAASATAQPPAATASPLPASTAPSAGTPIVAPPVAPAPTSSPQPTTAPAATAIPATAVPSATAQPAVPTSAPVSSPTPVPPTTAPPTAAPTMTPTSEPTLAPTAEPTAQPTVIVPTATAEPPATPTEMPTLAPPPQITQITLVVARAQSYESLGGVAVQIFEQGGSTPLLTRVTNEAGQIRLMLPPGGYRICASAGDNRSVSYPEGGCYFQTLQPGSAELMFLVA